MKIHSTRNGFEIDTLYINYPFNLGDNLAKMYEKVGEIVFGDKDASYNRWIATGLLFDEKLTSPEAVEITYRHFYLGEDAETAAANSVLDVPEHFAKLVVDGVYAFLKDHKYLLELDKSIHYHHLLADVLGFDALETDVILLKDFYETIDDSKFNEIMSKTFDRSSRSEDAIKDYMLKIIANRYKVKELARYSLEEENSNLAMQLIVLDKEGIDSKNWARLSSSVNKIFDLPTIIQIKSDLRTREELHFYDKIKDSIKVAEDLDI